MILPTIAGQPSEQPLPTLLKCAPFLRAYATPGEQETSRVAKLYRMPAAQRAALQDLDLFDPRHLSGWLAGLVQLRREGYQAVVEHLNARFRLRPGLTVARATDLLMAFGGACMYRSLVTDYGWPHDDYVDWLSDTLARQLLAVP